MIAYDILCYGSGDTIDEALEDHDRNIIVLLKRLRVSNLKLNKHKPRRNTPDIYGSSPVQKLFSRRTKTLMPTGVDLLKPQVIDEVKETIKFKRPKVKYQFDNSARPFQELVYGKPVRL